MSTSESDESKWTAIPDADTIAQAASIELFNVSGEKVTFGSLFEGKKVVVVFIRHFFCCNCQDYASQLSRVPKSALDNAGVEIVLVGCGDYQPIKFYSETTSIPPTAIYANPTRSLFHLLGMTLETTARTPKGEQKRSYVKKEGLWDHVVSFAPAMMKNASLIGKHGNHGQLGGDFVFGPGNQCSFVSRMKHTEDHVEVVDLMRAAGVAYEG
ncbi:hypothetical protein BJ165DRAFT_432391 [Panaeolus papilionaceus]|nr:hypothetical protein BJ165DRAFT_432391 [Panaeolus papilionaceus]